MRFSLFLYPRLNYHFPFFRMFFAWLKGCFLPDTIAFEELEDRQSVFFTNSGRTGLRLLLSSLQLKKGAKIGVQVYNCDSVFNAIIRAGYEPVFIDINHLYQMSLADLQRKVELLDALIVTHLFGFPVDLLPFRQVVGDRPILEDVSHGLFASLNQKALGNKGDAAFFSLGLGKFPNFGGGGFVKINNRGLLASFLQEYDRLEAPSVGGGCKTVFKLLGMAVLHLPFIFGLIGWQVKRRFRRTQRKWKEAKGALSLRRALFLQAGYFRKKAAIQNSHGRELLDKLRRSLNFLSPSLGDGYFKDYNPSFFLFPVQVKAPALFVTFMREQGFEVGTHFGKAIEWAVAYGYQEGSCPKAEKMIPQMVTLSCGYYLSPKVFTRMVNICLSYQPHSI